MIIELAAPVRGNTHADLQEVFFSLKDAVAYCRGVLGTCAGEAPDLVFTQDPDIRPFYVSFEGPEFVSLTDALDSTALIAAAQEKSWGYVNPSLQEETTSTETIG
jgi:hypothetical protein